MYGPGLYFVGTSRYIGWDNVANGWHILVVSTNDSFIPAPVHLPSMLTRKPNVSFAQFIDRRWTLKLLVKISCGTLMATKCLAKHNKNVNTFSRWDASSLPFHFVNSSNSFRQCIICNQNAFQWPPSGTLHYLHFCSLLLQEAPCLIRFSIIL